MSFPDVPGCISAGDTLDEALESAAEALGFHLAMMLKDGEPLPEVHNVAEIKADPEHADVLEDALVRMVEPVFPGEDLRLARA